MFERFSDDARRVVVLAQEEARLLSHDHIGTEHLLLGLLAERDGMAAEVLRSLDVDLDDARAQVLEMVGDGGAVLSGHIPFTPRAKKVLELSLREAMHLGHTYIGTEHILLGLCAEAQGVGALVLDTFGADLEHVRTAVLAALDGREGRPRMEYRTGPPLRSMSQVATMRAGPGPVVRPTPRCAMCGRDEERCEHVLVAGGMRICSDCARARPRSSTRCHRTRPSSCAIAARSSRRPTRTRRSPPSSGPSMR